MSESHFQRPIDDALIEAIWAKDPVAVRAALAAGASVEAHDQEHWETALTVAAHAGNAGEIIPILLTAGADLEARDEIFGNTPLMWATGHKSVEALRLLIAAGCDVNASNTNDETALHKCAARGNLAGAETLIAAGADVDANLDGEGTPLFEAILQGHPALVSVLVGAGADLNYGHSSFGPVLVAASTHSSSNVEVVAALLKAGAEVDATEERGRTALHEAVNAGKRATEGITSYSLSGHASNAVERASLTGARWFAERSRSAYAPRDRARRPHALEIVTTGTLTALRDMLSQGALCYGNDADLWKVVTGLQIADSRHQPAQTKTDWPLHTAASEKEIREVEELITYHHALDIRARSLSVIRLLLAAGASSLAQDIDGNSPLDLATFGGFEEAAATLADAARAWGRRPFEAASANGRQQFDVELVAAARANDAGAATSALAAGAGLEARDDVVGNTPLLWAASCGSSAVLQALISAGSDLSASNFSGETALHLCAASGSLAGVSLLIAAGAPVDAADAKLETPLYRAVHSSQPQNAALLVAAGATVDVRNRYGNTPLHRAAALAHPGLTKLLLASGAQPNATRDDGRTPLHVALAAVEWYGVRGPVLPNRRDTVTEMRSRTLEVIGELLEAGSSTSTADPVLHLSLAEVAAYTGIAAAIPLLEAAGAVAEE